MKSNQVDLRQTNLEVFRIVSMLMIVAHHYVVNSGIPSLYEYDHPTFNQLFLQCFGCLGKTGINCFTLLTGYFLVNSNSSIKKGFSLWAEFFFWQILFAGVFFISGHAQLTSKTFLMLILSPVFFSGKLYIETTGREISSNARGGRFDHAFG